MSTRHPANAGLARLLEVVPHLSLGRAHAAVVSKLLRRVRESPVPCTPDMVRRELSPSTKDAEGAQRLVNWVLTAITGKAFVEAA